MKYCAVILAFVAAVAGKSASELAAAIPASAKAFLDEAATSVDCDVTDYACQCGPKKQELTVFASPKIFKTCRTEAAAVLEAINALCEFVETNADAAGGELSSATTETTSDTSSAATSASGVAPNAAGMKVVNMGAMLGAAGAVAAMIQIAPR